MLTYEELLIKALGSKDRDFELNPLTQDEIEVVIIFCQRQSGRPDLDPELKEVYDAAVDVLKGHILN